MLLDAESGVRTHAARFPVPEGKSLCASVSDGYAYWAGFRPYD